MDCDEYQNRILTDYLDNQMNENERETLEKHLLSCRNCHEFYQSARKAVMEPFEEAQRGEPSEQVWQNIKNAISEEKNVPETTGLLDWLKGFSLVPKPAVVFAITFVFIMGVAVTVNNTQQFRITKNAITQSQAEDISYALDELASISEENSAYERSDIEEYFL